MSGVGGSASVQGALRPPLAVFSTLSAPVWSTASHYDEGVDEVDGSASFPGGSASSSGLLKILSSMLNSSTPGRAKS